MAQIRDGVSRGQRPNPREISDDIPQPLIKLMTDCWKHNAKERPRAIGKVSHNYTIESKCFLETANIPLLKCSVFPQGL